MSLDASVGIITTQMTVIQHLFLDHENELKTLKDLNDKSRSKILALEIQVQEMTSLAEKNDALITEMTAKKQASQELKRKYSQLEKEVVDRATNNLKLCAELKNICEKLGATREQSRQADLEESKIQANKSRKL